MPVATSPPLRALPWVLGAAGVLSQIVWVLLPEDLRDAATITSVLLLAAAGACHAAVHRGLGWAAALYGATAAIGLAVEAIGTATGYPFGAYRYADRLGPMVLDVPLLIPLAWCMAAYPMLLLAQRLGTRRWQVALIGAWTITAWDLFLDPQMVGQGYWTWQDAGWALPGIPGIPMQNFIGWLLAAMALMALLDRLPRKTVSDAVPNVLLMWVFASNVLANLVFFGRPGVALWGGICMGVVVVPWLWRMWSQPQW